MPNEGDDYDFGEVSSAELELSVWDSSLRANKRKACYAGRVLIRITSFRRTLIDEDNLCPKFFVDCCRYSGLVQDDSPDKVSIETRQSKVEKEDEERTEICLIPLE